MGGSAIRCDEIIDPDAEVSNNEETKTIPTNFNEKNIIVKTKKKFFLLAFLLITKALLRALNVYCFLIKCQTKQKHMFKKTDCNTKTGEIQNKITTDHAKYITT